MSHINYFWGGSKQENLICPSCHQEQQYTHPMQQKHVASESWYTHARTHAHTHTLRTDNHINSY